MYVQVLVMAVREGRRNDGQAAPARVPAIISGTGSIRKLVHRQLEAARRYAGNVSDLQRRHVLEALDDIEATVRQISDLVATRSQCR